MTEIQGAWWRDVQRAHSNDAADLPLISRHLRQAATSADDFRQKAALNVLADVTSALLTPDNWHEPFRPFLQLRDSRSCIPSDLTPDQLELLREIVAVMDDSDDPSLRARLCDVCWTYGNRRDSDMLDQAIRAYSCGPLEPGHWHGEGRAEWQRGLELVKRRGRSGETQTLSMATALKQRLDTLTPQDRFFGVQLSQMIRDYKLLPRKDFADVATLCVQQANAAQLEEGSDPRLERAWEREAAAWYLASGRRDDAYAAETRVARSYALEAQERRVGPPAMAMTADHFVEQALKVLSALPRTYRANNNLDSLVTELRTLIQHDRQAVLDNMGVIRSDPIDITDLVDGARRQVEDLEPLSALIELGSIHPWTLLKDAIARAEESARHSPLSLLLGNVSYSASGQKVAASSGVEVGTPAPSENIDPAIWSVAVRDHSITVGLTVASAISPALEVVAAQHRYTVGQLLDLCRRNPWIPAGHELAWARGLLHGLDLDFVSAASVLIPQLEHLVRSHLKGSAVHTLVTDEHGVETEKGLVPLLDDLNAIQLLGEALVFELKALLVDQRGPNLRNRLAHGLSSDAELSGDAAIYTWWIALGIATKPFMEPEQQLEREEPEASEQRPDKA